MAIKQQKFDPIEDATFQVANKNRGWSQKAREGALKRLSTMGMPSRRDEYWKYTNPTELLTEKLSVSSVVVLEDANIFSELDALKIVFCDGVFNPDLSDDLAAENIIISRLEENGDLHWAKNYYGLLEEKAQRPVSRSLAALNTAIASDGALIHVKAKVEKPILIFRHPK